VLLDGAGELSGLRRPDDFVDGAAAGVAQLISDLLVGQALQLELDRPALARRGQRSVPVPATDSWKHNRLKQLRGHAASPFLMWMRTSA